jgi:hypothetical protein
MEDFMYVRVKGDDFGVESWIIGKYLLDNCELGGEHGRGKRL